MVLFSSRWLAAPALLAAGALAVAGCGGGGKSAGAITTQQSTTTTTAPGGRGAGFASQLTAFRNCMSSHGVTLPTGGGRGRNGTPPSTTPGETFPPRGTGGGGGGFGGNFADRFATKPANVNVSDATYNAAYSACKSTLPTGNFNPQNNTAFQAYRSCLQDHGVTLPATGGFGGINRNDPKVQAALKTCQPLLPAGFGRGGGTTTTTAPAA